MSELSTDCPAFRDPLLRVPAQQPNRCTSQPAECYHRFRLEAKMVAPGVLARIEESYGLTRSRIDRGHVRTLVTIAEDALIRQIIERPRTPVFAAYDVIDLVSKASVVFMNATVLTPTPSPLSHFGTELCGNVTAAHARGVAGLCPLPFLECAPAP